MPSSDTYQRSLLSHIGTRKKAGDTREVTLISNISPALNQHTFFRQGLDTPALRTSWDIIAVTFTFEKIELERGFFEKEEPEYTIPEWVLPLEIKIFAGGGNPIIVDYLGFLQKEAKQKEQLEKLPNIAKKVMILEVPIPVETQSAQQLEVELRIEDKNQPAIAGTNLRYFMRIVEPEITLLVNQTFPA